MIDDEDYLIEIRVVDGAASIQVFDGPHGAFMAEANDLTGPQTVAWITDWFTRSLSPE